MKNLVALLSTVVALSSCSLQAAAVGGTGSAAAQIKPAQVATAAKDPSEFRKPTSARATNSFALDTSRFDSVSAKLNLDDEQKKKIAGAKSDIAARANALIKAQLAAQAALDTCQGDCTAARTRLLQATKDLQRFDAGAQFASHLWQILRGSQLETYLRIGTVNVDVKVAGRR